MRFARESEADEKRMVKSRPSTLVETIALQPESMTQAFNQSCF